MSAAILSVANQKGGVSKTTLTANLGYCLSQQGDSVLLVDLDPQASLTRIVGAAPNQKNMASVMGDTEPGTGDIGPVIRPLTERLAIAPGATALAQTELGLMLRREREFQLQAALGPAMEQYTWIVIDCPPSLGLLVSNALVASHWVIVPTELDQMSVDGIGLFMETLSGTQADYPDCARLMGVVAARADTRQVIQREMLEVLRRREELRLFETVIPERVKIREANLMQQAVARYAPDGPEAQAMQAFTSEVIARAHQQA